MTAGALPHAAAAAASCHRPPTHILDHKPKVTVLPGGAKLEVWDDRAADLRLSVVFVPHTSKLHLKILNSGAITRSATPTSVMRRHKRIVAISNGDILFPDRGGVPQGDEVVAGKVIKAISTQKNVTAISKSGQLRQAMLWLSGSVTAGGKTQPITGLNWQTLWGSGINVYTDDWGGGHRSTGAVEVVVSNGKVTAVSKSSDPGQTPRSGEQVLTASGGNAAAFLRGLKVNDPVTVNYTFHTQVHYTEQPIRTYEAINHDAPWLLEGKRWPVICNAKNESNLARTGLGWKRNGDFMLMTSSGPDHGRISGGTTAWNMEYYFKQLGAYEADAYDCDTSTTLAVRTRAGGAPQRQDHTNSAYQRPVPDYLAVSP